MFSFSLSEGGKTYVYKSCIKMMMMKVNIAIDYYYERFVQASTIVLYTKQLGVLCTNV